MMSMACVIPSQYTAEYEVGGFDEEMTGAEDIDLGIRTAHFGKRIRVDHYIEHDEGRVTYFNACAKKAYYGPGIMLFMRKYSGSGVIQMSRRAWLKDPAILVSPLGWGLLALKGGEILAISFKLLKAYLSQKVASSILGFNRPSTDLG